MPLIPRQKTNHPLRQSTQPPGMLPPLIRRQHLGIGPQGNAGKPLGRALDNRFRPSNQPLFGASRAVLSRKWLMGTGGRNQNLSANCFGSGGLSQHAA